MLRTWVSPRIKRPDPWTRGKRPTWTLIGRISVVLRPSGRIPSFRMRARVAALLRRGTREKPGNTTLQFGDMILDSDTYQVTVQDNLIQLTSTEHRLLRYLMEHPNQALSPSHLLQAVWEYPPNTGDPDLVRAHVRNLRAKIERDGARKYIRTIHGVGYMISS